jgi:hypothetical protein
MIKWNTEQIKKTELENLLMTEHYFYAVHWHVAFCTVTLPCQSWRFIDWKFCHHQNGHLTFLTLKIADLMASCCILSKHPRDKEKCKFVF